MNNILKYFLSVLFASVILSGCESLRYPEEDSSKDLTTLKCFVYYNGNDLSSRREVNLLSGTVNAERGLISFTFPNEEYYTRETLSRCHVEATIPATARLTLLDASGRDLGYGFVGDVDLYDTTLYFRITAADGSHADWQLTTRSPR